ncbi:MAG: KpsF/GutQ family sugar-phosphate isomerase [Verrucomicrobia bacterium]|nr:KpsF/GutQ family sugar-phosphate isomerase [Verrucomicrobiota bacterium]MBU6445788.1 KpsF/GutQ family sugar-phosphate isomerase [Verrucomicrobiota bacterium]MDE3047586.1 KpsF/GutQ family sugar-phosphate isomerase [Verrucomicrobiota bacterium]
MLKSLFEEQRQYLNHFFDAIDVSQVTKVLHTLLACRGMVICSGIGKSGHIAEKMAATFASTGTRALFLDPAKALHGDLGIVGPQDVVLFLSKSGHSQELVELLPHVQKRGAYTIAVISVPDSRLAQRADLTVVLPVAREICPHDLAPTTSTAAQLIFGDCLAAALMRAKQFSVSDFAANHPAGALGRKISFKVADLMLKGDAMPRCKPEQILLDVLHVLSMKRCGCLLIADERDRLCGIFTDGDLRRSIETRGPSALSLPLSDLMTPSPKCIAPDQLAFEAVQKMEEDPARLITVLPVLDEGKLVGLIRMHDILQKELT